MYAALELVGEVGGYEAEDGGGAAGVDVGLDFFDDGLGGAVGQPQVGFFLRYVAGPIVGGEEVYRFPVSLVAVLVDVDHEVEAGIELGGISALLGGVGLDTVEAVVEGIHRRGVGQPAVAVGGDTAEDAVDGGVVGLVWLGFAAIRMGGGFWTGLGRASTSGNW